MYTIGQVSQMTGLPISTLRYYDKVGLFSDLKRENGIRKFDDHDLDRIKTIECMKRSGLEIKDIKQYLDWCEEGESTLEQRLGLFERQLEVVEDELEQLSAHDRSCCSSAGSTGSASPARARRSCSHCAPTASHPRRRPSTTTPTTAERDNGDCPYCPTGRLLRRAVA